MSKFDITDFNSVYLEGQVETPCGCVMKIEADYESERCRCGGGCWDGDGTWAVKTTIVSHCDVHKVE